eukprot:TRINITY_DN18855_c0_g1_i1.p1 TRINITY_DN18855_c0_g1~~TRINITY_DN18855_c0_g1_i1.p1  ORF type:complete len:100 (+),score=32.25 TRINITY_DN18855_c0_g1_i1:143-442(+)
MLRSLVGSEMCIRDSSTTTTTNTPNSSSSFKSWYPSFPHFFMSTEGRCNALFLESVLHGQHRLQLQPLRRGNCLLYTSDAADEEDSADLRGCRITKKKK